MSLDERDYMRPKAEYWGASRLSWRRWLATNTWAPVWLVMIAMVAGSWAVVHLQVGSGLRSTVDKLLPDRRGGLPPAQPPAEVRRPVGAQARAPVPVASSADVAPPQPRRDVSREVARSPDAGSRSTTTVYRCKQGSQTSFSDSPDCPGGKASAMSIEVVQPPARDVTEAPAPSADERARQALADAQDAATAIARDQALANEQTLARARQRQQAAHRQAECGALEQHIQQLDALARQPQGGQTQDWIRGEREAARTRQFALRC